MVTASSRPRMTAGEFLAWERDQVEKHEWFEGEVFAMAGGTMRHAALGTAVSVALANALRGGPCRVFSSDQKIAARPGKQYVYPDASVLCSPRELEPGTTDVLANPSIVVEVLSAGTELYDRGLKWTGYQRIQSLTDYLLVSQSAARIEHFQRTGPETWSYRAWGPAERVVLANGASFAVDDVFAGVFELDGESPEVESVRAG